MDTNLYPLLNGVSNYNTTTDQISRFHLGETFYLLQITKEEDRGVPQYAIESEGHREDFSFDSFLGTLQVQATQYGLEDCNRSSFSHSKEQGVTFCRESFP